MVVLYFDRTPELTQKEHVEGDALELTLFIQAQPSSIERIEKKLYEINNRADINFSISFQQVTHPEPGCKVMIKYEPQKVICHVGQGKTIADKESIVISCYKSCILETMKNDSDTILRQASLRTIPKNYRVVIDCGHGGTDTGKVGKFQLQEKNVNLSVGKLVCKELKNKGYQVKLTRASDNFVALDRRTSDTNLYKADLFVSIHANGHINAQARGIETYWASKQKLFKNITPAIKKKYDAQDKASKLLAESVHSSVLTQSKLICYNLCDRCVRESPFQVLIGTEMPAILVELGFLSHEAEAQFLANKKSQEVLAQGISRGIHAYFKAVRFV